MKYALSIVLATLVTTVDASSNNTPFIYPAAGQSAETQEYDRYQCYRWAVTQTGVDPNTLERPQSTREVFYNANQGDAGRGTLIGTLAGAALGTLVEGDDSAALPGAIVGATIGTIVGANRENQGANTAKTQANARARDLQQQQDAYHSDHARYQRAFLACMQGRSYVIK